MMGFWAVGFWADVFVSFFLLLGFKSGEAVQTKKIMKKNVQFLVDALTHDIKWSNYCGCTDAPHNCNKNAIIIKHLVFIQCTSTHDKYKF